MADIFLTPLPDAGLILFALVTYKLCARQVFLFCNKASFYGEEFAAPRPTPKLEGHSLSAVRDCLFSIFVAIFHIGNRSSIRNLRTRRWVWYPRETGKADKNVSEIYNTVRVDKHLPDIWIKIDQLDVTCFIISLFTAQHVSNVSTSIFRSLWLTVDLFHVLYCSGSTCVGVTVWFGWGGVVSLCRLKLCFSLRKDTTPLQPNHTH